MTDEIITTRLVRGGFEVLAKNEKGDVSAKTYANRTQAQAMALKLVSKLGTHWDVIGERPFYVRKLKETLVVMPNLLPTFIVVQTGFDQKTNEPVYQVGSLVGTESAIYKTATQFPNPRTTLDEALKLISKLRSP